MSQLQKVSNTIISICGIEIATTGTVTPATTSGWQPFYNSIIKDADFTKIYFGLGSVSFAEQSGATSSGTVYKQKLEFRFPANDPYRSERIAFFEKLKFVKVLLSNETSFLIGRNDFLQNALPKIVVKSTSHITEVEIQTISIFATGFAASNSSFGLPALIPFTLIPQ